MNAHKMLEIMYENALAKGTEYLNASKESNDAEHVAGLVMLGLGSVYLKTLKDTQDQQRAERECLPQTRIN